MYVHISDVVKFLELSMRDQTPLSVMYMQAQMVAHGIRGADLLDNTITTLCADEKDDVRPADSL